MNEQELKDALAALSTKLEGKSKEEVKNAIESFETKHKESVQGEFKSLFDAEIKGIQEDLEAKLKAVQDHADKLDVKMQENKANTEVKSFSGQILEILDSKKQALEELKKTRKEGVSFSVKAFKAMETKVAGTMSLGNYTGGTVGLTDLEGGLTRIARRNPFLREIVNVRPVSSSYVAWAEQANPDGGAAATAEGAAKSQADFDIVEASKKIEKITAYIKVSKEALDDINYLNSEINSELVELINLKLDADILGANGTTPNIKGILSYATAFSVAGTPLALGVDEANNFDVIRAAAWQVISANFRANYVLVNPVDAASMDLTKATDGHYIMPPFATIDGQTIAGLRVIENTGVTAGDFLVGDFTKSNLGIREDINIQVGYENDDFTKNLITILAEVRAVHYIKSNHTGAFVTGTFSTAKTALETT